ncbi:MAG: YqiA/YcfP family alpha/beta fold hydrolase [Dysgonamonadaceae bacterium]
MTNILYIHGFGSDANLLTSQTIRKELSTDFQVITHSFSNDYGKFQAMIGNIEQAKELLKSKNIDLVIASSMGGFVGMGCTGITKILINPCMKPSEQLRLRIVPDISDEQLNEYRTFESFLLQNPEDVKQTYGLFSTKDELFSYKDLFDTTYNPENSFSMDDTHRISIRSIRDVLVPLVYEIKS